MKNVYFSANYFTMNDSPRHQGLRNRLVNELKQKGIQNRDILEAIAHIPRHLFLDSAFERHAYEDKAFPISAEQTISQPYTVAFQTELLDVQKGEKVLEIGTGSGYQAAVLIFLGAQVYTVERKKELFLIAQKNLQKIGMKVKYAGYGDGYKGLPLYAPFDKIIVTAAAPHIPDALIEQLKPEGKMVIPVGQNEQTMLLIEKNKDGQINQSRHGLFRFVPMLRNKD